MEPVSLFRVALDGKVVAEAELKVYDQEAAWATFIQCYPAVAHLIAGELFATMHAACDDDLRARTEDTGITLEIEGGFA